MNTRKSGQIIQSKKRPHPTRRSGRGSRTNSNTSRQIPARVIEADSPSAVVYGGADMPLIGPLPAGGTFFYPHCGSLYSVTYSRLSKSDSNLDVPLAPPVRAASIRARPTPLITEV